MSNGVTVSGQPYILVTGVGGPAGISTTAYLKRKGFSVIGTDMRPVETLADLFFEVPAATDPSFIPAIVEVVSGHTVPLLIPTVSEELPVFAREASAFSKLDCRVVIAPVEAVEIANDKLRTSRILEQQGVAVPPTLEGSAPHSEVIDQIGLPVIAKPRVSRGGRGVVLYTEAEALVKERRPDIIYQAFMKGEEYDINIYVNTRGQAQSCVVLRKTELKDGVVGNALAVERVIREDIAELGRQAAAAIGLTGPADMDVRLGADGVARVLEINARIGANVLTANDVLDDLLLDFNCTSYNGR